MPVRAGAVRLPTRDEADGEFPLAGQRADRGGHSARGNASDLTEQAAPIQTIRAQSLQDGEHHLSVRYGRQQRGVQPLRPDREALGDSSGRSSGTGRRTRAGIRARSRQCGTSRCICVPLLSSTSQLLNPV